MPAPRDRQGGESLDQTFQRPGRGRDSTRPGRPHAFFTSDNGDAIPPCRCDGQPREIPPTRQHLALPSSTCGTDQLGRHNPQFAPAVERRFLHAPLLGSTGLALSLIPLISAPLTFGRVAPRLNSGNGGQANRKPKSGSRHPRSKTLPRQVPLITLLLAAWCRYLLVGPPASGIRSPSPVPKPARHRAGLC